MESSQLKTSFGDSYSFTYSESMISIDAYLLGSITGGSGTEKKSEVSGTNLKELLYIYSATTVEDLFASMKSWTQTKKDKFVDSIVSLEMVTFIWSETDWSDTQ